MMSLLRSIVAIGFVLAASCTTPQIETTTVTPDVMTEADRIRALQSLTQECPLGNRDCSAADLPTIAFSSGPAPIGAAGFDLDMIGEVAKQHCHSANKLWSVTTRDLVECSGSVGADIPFHVNMQLCDGSVCRIVLSQHVTEASAIERWKDVSDDLAIKFGPPCARDEITSECQRPTELGGCVEHGFAKPQAAWIWKEGQAVSVELVAPSPQHLFVFVVYSAPAVGREVHARGL